MLLRDVKNSIGDNYVVKMFLMPIEIESESLSEVFFQIWVLNMLVRLKINLHSRISKKSDLENEKIMRNFLFYIFPT